MTAPLIQPAQANGVQEAPPHVLIIFDPKTWAFAPQINGAIPFDKVIHALETLKFDILTHQQAELKRQMQNRPRVTLPDGSIPPPITPETPAG